MDDILNFAPTSTLSITKAKGVNLQKHRTSTFPRFVAIIPSALHTLDDPGLSQEGSIVPKLTFSNKEKTWMFSDPT